MWWRYASQDFKIIIFFKNIFAQLQSVQVSGVIEDMFRAFVDFIYQAEAEMTWG